MIALSFIAAALAMSSPGKSDDAAIQTNAEKVAARFAKANAGCGYAAPPVKLVAQTTPGMIFYDPDSNSLTYPLWREMDSTAQATWAARGSAARPKMTGQAYVSDVFNSLLIPHELGHQAEALGGRKLDWWSSEYHANRVMIAFWRLETSDRVLQRRLESYWAYEAARPSPVPAGRDVAKFFNASKFDPNTYGWYQSEMTRRAWAARNEVNFCQLLGSMRGASQAAPEGGS